MRSIPAENPIGVRQVKYLNSILEQNNRAIKPMLNFKSFWAARNVLAGIELMHMIRKGQLVQKVVPSCLLPMNFMHWQGKSV
jgi:transposase-like protein